MKDLEQLKNVNLNIDSETARQIAEQYLTYKYIVHFSIMVLMVLIIVGFVLFVRFIIRSAQKNKSQE